MNANGSLFLPTYLYSRLRGYPLFITTLFHLNIFLMPLKHFEQLFLKELSLFVEEIFDISFGVFSSKRAMKSREFTQSRDIKAS